MRRNFLAWLLVVALTLSLCGLGAAAHWADPDVAYWVEQGTLTQSDPLLSNLDTPITRMDVARLLVLILGGSDATDGTLTFSDLESLTEDERTLLTKAKAAGYISGFPDGTFRSEAPVTRQDFCTMLGRAYALEQSSESLPFSDNAQVATYSRGYLAALVGHKIIGGYADQTLRPDGWITVGEALAVLRRSKETLPAPNAEPKPEEIPKEETKPSSSGGGGGGGTTVDRTPPTLNCTLSATDATNGPVIVTVDVSDRSLKRLSYLRAEFAPMRADFPETDVGYVYSSTDYSQFGPGSINLRGDNPEYDRACGGGGYDGAWKVVYTYQEHETADPERIVSLGLSAPTATITQNGEYYFCAEDTTGNRTIRRVVIRNLNVAQAEFAVSYAPDFKGDVVAYLTPTITENPNAPLKLMALVRIFAPNMHMGFSPGIFGVLGGSPVPRMPEVEEMQTLKLYQEASLLMEPVDGVFPIRDFGVYACVMLDVNDNIFLKEIIVRPPVSADTTPTTLSADFTEAEGDAFTITVNAGDDVALAKVSWVAYDPTKPGGVPMWHADYGFAWLQTGRQSLAGTSFQVPGKGSYYICAMDTSGNASFAQVIIPKPNPHPCEK